MNLLLVEPHEVDQDGVVHLSDGRATHVLRVMRVVPGQEVRVGVVDGQCGTGTVTSIGPGAVVVRCALGEIVPPRPRIDLLLAVPRPKVLRRLWAQLAALGVGRIILTNAERVERDYFDTHILTPDCYRPLLIEGLQQARDTRLPVVSIHRRFKVLVEDELDAMFGGGLRVVTDPAAEAPLPDVIANGHAERLLMAVGPEGGWNAFEVALLEAHGFRRAGMGSRTLRTDTACVALLALAHAAMRAA